LRLLTRSGPLSEVKTYISSDYKQGSILIMLHLGTYSVLLSITRRIDETQ